jgi:hypothetical protein
MEVQGKRRRRAFIACSLNQMKDFSMNYKIGARIMELILRDWIKLFMRLMGLL